MPSALFAEGFFVISILMVISLVLVAYVFLSYVLPFKATWKLKLGLTLFFLVISQKFSFYYYFGGHMFNPVLPETTLIIWETLFNILLVLVPLLVVKDLLFVLVTVVNKGTGSHVPWPLKEAKNRWLLLIFSVAAAISGTHYALTVPTVHRVEITLDRLAPEFDGYRIVQLADLHVGHLLKRPWLEAVIDSTNELKPDAIVLVGDMIEGPEATLASEVQGYGRLKAADGVYGVTGNHEWHHGAATWIEYFEKNGIRMLENKHHVIARGNAQLVLAGTTDLSATRYGAFGPDLKKALEGAPEAATILLAHQPKGAKELQGVDLQLSGHTHGGLYALLQPVVAFFNDGFVAGLYQANKTTQLYVSPGTGLWTGMALRVMDPSEITEIVLRARPVPKKKDN